MAAEIKTLDGIMNLDDSNDIFPTRHHKEARNGVFKGNAPEMHFTSIRGNVKVENTSMIVGDCKLAGSVLFMPNCIMEGMAVYIPVCDIAGTAILQVNFTITKSCVLNDGKIIIGGITGGGGTYEIGNLAYSTEAAALAATSFTEGTSKTFNNMPDGILWFVVRDKNNTSNKIAKSVTIACNDTSTECRSSVSVVISSVPTEVFYQDCCSIVRSVSYTTVGTYTISDCIKAGSLSSPDTGFSSFTYGDTTCDCVDFRITKSCVLNDGKIIVDTLTGGGGIYEIGDLSYATEAAALASTAFTEATSKTFNNMPDGTLWFVVRDKDNVLNRTAKSVTIACNGTSTECRDSVSVVINAVPTEVFYEDCCENVKSVAYATNGTYTITDCIKVGSLSSPDSGFASFTYSETVCECVPPDATPNWVDKGYNVCIDCVSYDVYRDENENSLSYLKYKVNGVVGTTTAPIESSCNTTANYSENVGTYYRCSAGNTLSNTVYKNTNTCFTGNQYKSGTITYATDPSNTLPSTDAILTDQGYNTCYQCVDRLVYRDSNACSPSFNEYFVNGDNVGSTAPSAALCPTTSNWVDLEFKTCYGCQELQVYQNQQACVANSYKYRIGGTNGVVVDTRPSNTLCDYAANWVLTGHNTCSGCVNYPVYRDMNGCSATYAQYRVNNVVVGLTEPTRGNCNTTASYQDYGGRVCIDCYSKQPQRDETLCSPTYGNIQYVDPVYGAAPCNTTDPSYTQYEGVWYTCFGGTVYETPVYSNTNVCYNNMANAQFKAGETYFGIGSNPVNSYPSTAANWMNLPIDQYWDCEGNVRYYVQQDINPCSPTSGQTQRGAMDGIVAGYCGYNPTICTSYEIVNFDANYDVYVDYIACGGGAVSDTVSGGQTMTICAETGSASISGYGSISDVGTCSS